MLSKDFVATFSLGLAKQTGTSCLLAKAGKSKRSCDLLGLILVFRKMPSLSWLWIKGFAA